jgi:hypothetical protein
MELLRDYRGDAVLGQMGLILETSPAGEGPGWAGLLDAP